MNDQEATRSGRIVSELRHRIEAGELKPGERVPSTREIVRRWGVAMATATKVLTELRQLGLTEARSGVGTVVAARSARSAGSPPARRRPAPDHALTLDRIVVAAVAVADTEGLAGVSMRRVAHELGVATMALYRYVQDKDDLVLQMMDLVMAELELPDPSPAGWRERLEHAAHLMWDLFRRHHWLAPAMSVTRPQIMPNVRPYTEWILETLDHLDLEAALTVHVSLFNYVRGTAINLETEAEAEAITGMDADEWVESQDVDSLLDPAEYPRFHRLVHSDYEFSLDRIFEFGLQRLLDGYVVFTEKQ
ncbi:TetR/AcrR family transcriptional regulator [Flindersiella endophytica]